MHSSEYELGNVGEDFGLQPIGEDDEHFNDDETFGDTGPLNDDWEQSHELLAQTHEQHLSTEGWSRNRPEQKLPRSEEEDNEGGFFPFLSLENRSANNLKDHSHTHASNSVGTYKTEPARPPDPFTTRLPPGALPPSSRPSPGLSHNGLDDESYGLGGGDVDDDQLEDMFRGVLSDESDQHRGDQYFSSPHHPRSQTHVHQHFMGGTPIDRPGLAALADSPSHPSIWGRSPASSTTIWGSTGANQRSGSEPVTAVQHHEVGHGHSQGQSHGHGHGHLPANASSPPPGFAPLPQSQQFPALPFPAQQFPSQQLSQQMSGQQFTAQHFPGLQQPPVQHFPGLQLPDHTLPAHPPKMLSVEELEARLIRQSQQLLSNNLPSQLQPHQQQQQQQQQQQHPQPQQPPLAILQQLQQLQHLQHMRPVQHFQQSQQAPTQPDPSDHQPAVKAPPSNITPGPTPTQVYVRKNANNFQHNYRGGNDGNNNNHTNHYPTPQKPRGITLGDMLPLLKAGRTGSSVTNGVIRGPRYERKQMMTQEEIETIIYMQHAQLHSNHPYTDDYYYYQLQKRRGSRPLTRDEPPDIVRHHKPLCESTPSRTFPPKKIINDPLAGSLGRIPSHNVRAPRTLLQLIATEMEEKEDGTSSSLTTDDRTELGVHQALLLAVENAFNYLLDIEDIDLILSSSNGSVNVSHLMQKRDELSMDLFRSLNFDVYPLSKTNPPVPIPPQPFSLNSSATIPTSASINARIIPQVVQEDEFFVGLALISKGKKLLARAIPLFPPSIAVPVLLAFMRNFLFLLAHNEREKEKEKGSKMFIHLNFLIGGLATPHVLLAFHTLLLFHGEMAILKLLQYQESVDVILNFMRRGHELTQESGGPNAAHVPPAAHWRGMFAEFLKRVSFGRTLPPVLSRPFMWELVLAMAVDADDFQRSMITESMRDDILSQPHLDQLPTARTIRSILNL